MANYDIDINAKDNASRKINKIDRNLRKLEKSAKKSNGILSKIGIGLAAGGAAGALATRGLIAHQRAYDLLNTKLRVYLGSQSKATQELKRLQTLANSLPQDLNDITSAYTIFTRYGIDTSSKAMKAWSNVAVANGKTATQLAEAIGDALTGEFERLKEFGIKVSKENDEFVARMGDTVIAVSDTASGIVDAVQASGTGVGKFAQAATIHTTTLDQSFSNLTGAIFSTKTEIMKGLGPALKSVADDMADMITENDKFAKSFGIGLGEAVTTIADGMSVIKESWRGIKDAAIFTSITILGGALLSARNAMVNMLKSAGTFLTKFSAIGKIIVIMGIGLAAVGKDGVDAFNFMGRSAVTFGQATSAVWQTIKDVGSWAFGALAGDSTTFWEWFTKSGRWAANTIIGIFKGLLDTVAGFFEYLARLPHALMGELKNLGKLDLWDILFNDDHSSLDKVTAKMGNNLKGALKQSFDKVDYFPDTDFVGKMANMPMAPSFDKDWNVSTAFTISEFVDAIGEIGTAVADASVGKRLDEIIAADKLAADLEEATLKADNFLESVAAGNEINKSASIGIETTKTTALTEVSTSATRIAKSIQEANKEIAELEDGLKNASAMADMFGISEDKLTQKLKDQLEALKGAGDGLAAHFEQIGQSLSKSMADAMARGELTFDSFSGFMKTWAQNLMSKVIQDQLMDPLSNALTNWMSSLGGFGGGGNMFNDILGFFAGGFAHGGHIPGGKFGLVGEQGPELITGPANITPINNTSGGAPVNVTINLSAIDSQSGTQFLISKKQEIAGIIQQAYNQQGKNGIY